MALQASPQRCRTGTKPQMQVCRCDPTLYNMVNAPRFGHHPCSCVQIVKVRELIRRVFKSSCFIPVGSAPHRLSVPTTCAWKKRRSCCHSPHSKSPALATHPMVRIMPACWLKCKFEQDMFVLETTNCTAESSHLFFFSFPFFSSHTLGNRTPTHCCFRGPIAGTPFHYAVDRLTFSASNDQMYRT